MSKFFIGCIVATMLLLGGFLFVYGQAQEQHATPLPPPAPEQAEKETPKLPQAGDSTLVGPAPPEATELTREQKRFNRYDRNFDQIITRREMLASRTNDFKKLDKDGNNLLTFEEWAVRTSDRFEKADSNDNGELTPAEFATTRTKKNSNRQRCNC